MHGPINLRLCSGCSFAGWNCVHLRLTTQSLTHFKNQISRVENEIGTMYFWDSNPRLDIVRPPKAEPRKREVWKDELQDAMELGSLILWCLTMDISKALLQPLWTLLDDAPMECRNMSEETMCIGCDIPVHVVTCETLSAVALWHCKSNETPTWYNTVHVLFLQGHSTCFGRKRPSSGVFKTSTAATGTCVIVVGQSSHLIRPGTQFRP